MMKEKEIKKVVRDGYARIARQGSCCCGPVSSCCGSPGQVSEISRKIGYTEEEINQVPKGANLGLGCGNPVALASLREGETVLDLGSGAGFDCFLAADRVGQQGRVIGVDMTPEMIEKARANAEKNSYTNVEFRLGEIEELPVEDNSVDVVISNCVINLSPDKGKAFTEAYRVLKLSGRIMVSDIVLLKPIPDAVKNSVAAYIGCISGAVKKDEYLFDINAAGFRNIKVIEESSFPIDCIANDSTEQAIIPGLKITPEELEELTDSVVSIKVQALKPV